MAQNKLLVLGKFHPPSKQNNGPSLCFTLRLNEPPHAATTGLDEINIHFLLRSTTPNYLKGHCHEHSFKNSTAQKHVYTIGNLVTVVKFS